MAKDALGHGSEKRGGNSVPEQHRARIADQNRKNPLMGYFLGGDMRPEDTAAAKNTLDQIAARSLGQGHDKSSSAPVHDGASGRSAEEDEYNRDLRLRARNGQVGSGMKFR